MNLRGGVNSANPGPALPELHRRLRWVALVGIGAFALLVGRLWQLQVMRGESYYERTVSNVIKERYLPSVRGKILDRNGVPLADNRPAFNLYATPKKMTPAVRAELERLLGLSDEELGKIDERLAVGTKRDANAPVLVLEDQGRERAALVEQARASLPGVEVHYEPYRYYPQGDMAAHLIGYMTQMTPDEADKLGQRGYDTSELIGRAGLEAAWENYLRGKKGVERYAVDARGEQLDDETARALIEGDPVKPPVPGANLVLTIDAGLQRVAEQAASQVPAAAVVVVDVKTGKLRAVVSKPSFDPNVMTDHLTKAEYTLLATDPRKPFVDKAMRATFPPGSIFKFVTALAALEDGQGAEDETIACNGEFQLGHTRFYCHDSHGRINMLQAIQHSCDVYFWTLAQREGLDAIARVATDYGLGAPTKLGLNGDSAGVIPTEAWYAQHGGYKPGFAINAGIGQGDIQVTVLQMAMAYAALANGGTLYLPQVVDRIEAPDGHTIATYGPQVEHVVHAPAKDVETWKKGMYLVANEHGGTAYNMGHIENLVVLGKTGTAEVKKHHRADMKDTERWNPNAAHAWFAGFAPADDPEIAVVVLVEHGGEGGMVSWPIARKVFEYYFTKIHPLSPPPVDVPGRVP